MEWKSATVMIFSRQPRFKDLPYDILITGVEFFDHINDCLEIKLHYLLWPRTFLLSWQNVKTVSRFCRKVVQWFEGGGAGYAGYEWVEGANGHDSSYDAREKKYYMLVVSGRFVQFVYLRTVDISLTFRRTFYAGFPWGPNKRCWLLQVQHFIPIEVCGCATCFCSFRVVLPWEVS